VQNTTNKNLFQNLDSVKAIAELTDKAAATCAGGYEFSSSSSSSSSSSVSGGGTVTGFSETINQVTINGVPVVNERTFVSFP
jgi:hypothetical protein